MCAVKENSKSQKLVLFLKTGGKYVKYIQSFKMSTEAVTNILYSYNVCFTQNMANALLNCIFLNIFCQG